MAQWVKALQMNWKIPGSNLTTCLARFSDSTSLQGFWWLSSRNLNKCCDWHWMSDYLLISTKNRIWQRHKGLVIGSWPFLLLITNSIKNQAKFSEDFCISSFQIISFPKELLRCKECRDYIYQSLSMHSGLALQLQIRSFLVRTLQDWTLENNFYLRFSRLLLINIK